MINISSTTPSTIFCTLHFTIAAPSPQSYHACANSKLISCRRHLPVLHSDPGHAHGHTPAAGPYPTPEGITAPGRSPKNRQTRQYDYAKINHGHDRLRPLTFDACVSPTKSDQCTAAKALLAECRLTWCMSLQAISGSAVPASDSSPRRYLRRLPGLFAC